MSDRVPLLKAIAANPDEDTPRLVYADWLDEHGGSDHDRATAEFIRVSCKMGKKTRQSAVEGRWLWGNWKWLVPSLLPLHTDAGQQVFVHRSGRTVRVRVHPIGWRFGAWAVLEFWRGFVRTAGFYQPDHFDYVAPALLRDQPLAVCDFPRAVRSGWGESRFAEPISSAGKGSLGPFVFAELTRLTADLVENPRSPRFATAGSLTVQFMGRDSGRVLTDAVRTAATVVARRRSGVEWLADLPVTLPAPAAEPHPTEPAGANQS